MRGAGEAPVDGATVGLTPDARRRPVLQGRPPRPPAPRLVYVDWLRVVALIGVFVIHVCSVFDPFDEWHIQNSERSRYVGEVIVLMAPWIMPLFMLLAGVSAWYSLLGRGNARYLRERVLRLLVPLIAGTLLLVPPQVYLERRLHGQFTGSLWAFYPHFFDGIYPRGNLSWHHLWFLAHLFGYSLIALPLFRYWQSDRGRGQLRWLARRCSGPAGLLWLALPLVLERHLLWWVFRERHMLTSDWSNHAVLFVAYVYGFALAGEPTLGAAIDKHWRGALATAILTTSLLVIGTWRGIVPAHLPEPYHPGYLAFWTLYAVGAWASMASVLAAGRRWLVRETPLVAYGRSAGYAWYLVHQPVIVAIAFVVVGWRAGVAVKLIVLAVASFLGTLIGGELLGRSEVMRRAFGLCPTGLSSSNDA
ncbi:MAG TPA: acyltransferase [Gemmatimonadaceae bacterium]